METTVRRRVPLIVVAGRDGTALVECLRAQGAVVYQTRTPEGCLRVATAVRPDIIVLPRGFPRGLARLLQQHPSSAGARIVWVRLPATAADENLVADRRSQPALEAAPRQLTTQDLVRIVAQLTGESLERSGPAHA